MAWTTPRTWTVGELVTKAILDTHVRDNLTYLKDHVDDLETKGLPVILNTDTAIIAGDGLLYIPVPSTLNGYNLSAAKAYRQSGSGTLTIMVHNETDGVDMLTSGAQPGTPGTVDTSNDDVATGDIIRIDIDSAGTSSLHCSLVLEFTLP